MKSEEEGVHASIRIFRGVAVCVLAAVVGYFVYVSSTDPSTRFPFKFGLDLAGGSHLVYEANVTNIAESEVKDAMSVLRDVIERRTNLFGVAEPLVQIEESSVVAGARVQRLVVELPGVTDIDEAVRQIGKTPLLEFKLVDEQAIATKQAAEEATKSLNATNTIATVKSVNGEAVSDDPYIPTKLTGRYLKRSNLVFGSGQGSLANEPIVQIEFNDEGAQLFEDITKAHVGERLAIFLDGEMVSSPRINEAISGGKAVISGQFTPDVARELVRNLNFGALPVPIELVSTQTIGASLGERALRDGLRASLIGFALVALFMILWYRLPGVIATVALVIYLLITLALIKLIPVTLTASGIAALILSIGMAVDANVLIFERMKEELRQNKSPQDAVEQGFRRAWPAIRDGHLTMLISSAILFWMGTSIVQGFALVFGLGVITSLLTAVSITRVFLIAVVPNRPTPLWHRLLETGLGRPTNHS